MPRGDRSRHPYRGVSGAFRGTVGYSGVSADAQNDPAVVFPPRPVTVPAAATIASDKRARTASRQAVA
jgi:hypothetical protein